MWAAAKSGWSRIAAKFGNRLLPLPLRFQHRAQVHVGHGEIGLEPKRLTPCGDRLRHLPLRSQDGAEVQVSISAVGPKPNRRAALFYRLVQFPLFTQGIAEIAVGHGEVGLKPDRLTAFGDRLLEISPGLQNIAEVHVAHGKVRIEPDRLTTFGDCLLEPPLIGQFIRRDWFERQPRRAAPLAYPLARSPRSGSHRWPHMPKRALALGARALGRMDWQAAT